MVLWKETLNPLEGKCDSFCINQWMVNTQLNPSVLLEIKNSKIQVSHSPFKGNPFIGKLLTGRLTTDHLLAKAMICSLTGGRAFVACNPHVLNNTRGASVVEYSLFSTSVAAIKETLCL